MSKLTSRMIRAIRASEATEDAIVAAIEAAKERETAPPRRRTYNRRDMRAEA